MLLHGKTMPYWAGKTTLCWQDKEARQKKLKTQS